MAVQFGNTWWGQAYLGALTQIDYENRLARGKSYARNERVLDIDIRDNMVNAKVQGSRSKPYKVRLVHVPLLPADQKKLTSLLASRPDLTSEILNLRLPSEVLELCQNIGVQLFPSTWRDIKLTCSCPDWAVPCKHIAAVIYLISNEIDKDPFMVFKLLQFDLAAALAKKGVVPKTTTALLPVPSLSSILIGTVAERGKPPFDPQVFNTIDLSSIPHLGTTIPGLLEPRPVFYPQDDFRMILEILYSHLCKKSADKRYAQKAESVSFADLRKIDYLELVLDERLTFNALWLEGPEEQMTSSLENLETVIYLLESLEPEQLSLLASDFALIHTAWQIALHCVRAGAMIPVLLAQSDKTLFIQWQMCTHVHAIHKQVQLLSQILRQDFVTIELYNGEISNLDPAHQTRALINLFIHYFVTGTELRLSNPKPDPVFAAFFQNQSLPDNSVSDRRTCATIYQWLSLLYNSGHGYQPRIWIHEKRNQIFELTVELESEQNPEDRWVPLSDFMEDKRFAQERTGVLQMLSQLGEYIPSLRNAIRHQGKKPISLKEDEVIRMLGLMETVMQVTGMKIMLPKSLENLLRPKRSLQIKGSPKTNSAGILALEKILSFEWRIAVGDQSLSPEEFMRMTRNAGQLIKIKDQYVLLDPQEMQRLYAQLSKANPLSGPELLRYAIAEEFDGTPVQLTAEVIKWLTQFREAPDIPVPARLNATLRPYQLRGFSWLWKNAKLGFGSMLADDMGLGKTLQVLTFLQKAKEAGWLDNAPALIVAPATILTNWSRECERFTPDLISYIYHGAQRTIPKQPFDILITTYGLLRADQKKLAKISWSVIVIDEAQQIKNTTAAQTRAVWEMPAQVRIAMSGTPVENRLSEYFSISQFVNPGYLGTQASFRRDFSLPIEQHRNQHRLDLFRRMTAPFILRRLKTDKSIIHDLPDKIVINRYIALTPEQASLYEATTQRVLQEISQAENEISRKGLVLKLLLQLKQICNHPAQFLKRGKPDSGRTGKSEALREIIEQIRDGGQKAIIFTQYREMGEILLHMLREWGEDAQFLHGGLTRKERDHMVSSFQEHHWPSVLVLSIKAAGTGLNLTAATHVIHYDLWWNPAVEAQATDRAFRIGQKHNVTVHRIITRNTLEEQIDQLMERKKQLADMTVTAGEKWIGELTNTEIQELVVLKDK